MHHFGEDSTIVFPTDDGFEAVFTNKSTGQKIRMRIPEDNLYHHAGRKITKNEAEDLAREIAHLLRQRLV